VDSRLVQHSHIIQLEHVGIVGLGEVTAHPFYNISREKILQSFSHVKGRIEDYSYDTPDRFWDFLSPLLADNLFLLSGIDIASNDLYGKIKNISVCALHNLDQTTPALSSYTIGIDEISVMKDKLKATPWPVYKIKLGTQHDVEIIQALRKTTNAPFRIDANCAWDLRQLSSYTSIFRDLNVEFIEQAIHPNNIDAIIKARAHTSLPLIADESFKTIKDLPFCIENFDGINIKLVKCGGLTPAIKIAKAAKKAGLKLMIGCMTESSISISAASQLTGIADYIDLDGALLLKDDIAIGTTVVDGKITRSDGPGIGCELTTV